MRVGIGLLSAAVAIAALMTGCGGGASGSATLASQPTGLIAFTHQDAHGVDRIFVIRPDGSGRRALTTHDSLDAVWSPDGKKLAFLDHRQDLVVMNADGSDSRIVSREQGLAEDELASWSPDGTRLVFDARLTGGRFLFVVNADGTGKRRLGVSGLDPDWSPDGKRILFIDSRGQVAVIGVDGGGLHELTHFGCSENPPRWSPDGKQIAFNGAADCSGGGSIQVMNADGSGRHVITPGGGGYYNGLAWSSDGTHIVFSRGPDFFSLGNLYVVGADGSGLRRITTDGKDFDPSWR